MMQNLLINMMNWNKDKFDEFSLDAAWFLKNLIPSKVKAHLKSSDLLVLSK